MDHPVTARENAVPIPSGAAIELHEVGKYYGIHAAVDHLSLVVPRGQVYGFLGPNGAGKTTTLRMITGILEPSSGRVQVLGGITPGEARARLGYLPEEKGLYKDMKVVDMVAYFGALRGLGLREAKARAADRLARAGLGEWLGAKCNALSKGMGQQAQVIAALLHDPELVVLDEPFSGLDPVNAEMVLELIKQYRREGRTVLFSTHVVEHAEQICDAVAIIHHGRLVVNGPLEEVKARAGRSVLLDYEGTLNADTLPGVISADDAGHHAELRLAPEADTQRLLHLLTEQVRIHRFDTREVSLKQVFLAAVGHEGTRHAA